MAIQAQTLQQGGKFKESEVRPQVEQQMERKMVLGWIESQGEVNLVDKIEFNPEDELGVSPEDLVEKLKTDGAKEASAGEAPPPPKASEAKPAAQPEAKPDAAAPPPAVGGGFEWGETCAHHPA